MHFAFIPVKYADRQLALKDFSRAVKAALRQDVDRTFNHEQLMLMLLELAKNTFDHSSGIGILNMQLPAAGMPLSVNYQDTGEPFDWAACSAPGLSAKAGNGVNFGLGLAIVRQGCSCTGISLTVERLKSCTEFRFQGTSA